METIRHAMKSMELFGESAMEVHIWIDKYWNGVPDNHDHRRTLHTPEGRESCLEKFGEWSVKHFDQHMKDDGLGVWDI